MAVFLLPGANALQVANAVKERMKELKSRFPPGLEYGIFYDTVSARSQYAQNTIEGPTWPWTTGIGTQTANAPTAP